MAFTPLKARPQTIALHGLGKDDRRLPLVIRRGLERGIDFAVVVTTSTQRPNVVIAHLRDHLCGARVTTEEILPDKRPVFGLVGLEISVRSGVHQIPQRAIGVGLEQWVPFPAPDDLDDVPSGSPEVALQLLDDFPITPDRSVEPLQVAVNDKRQVVQIIVRCNMERTTRFDFVHLAIAEKRPDVLVGRVFDTAVRQIAVQLRLVNRVDRTESHRHRRKLPEIRHKTGVGIGAEPT